MAAVGWQKLAAVPTPSENEMEPLPARVVTAAERKFNARILEPLCSTTKPIDPFASAISVG